MSYIDASVLKSFYSDNSFMVKQDTITEISSIVTQIDGLIKSKLGLDTPANPSSANDVLQNIACRLFIWFAAGKEGITKEMWDYQRRKSFYETALDDLDKIQNGAIKIYDTAGTVITIPNQTTAMFESTKRITGIL